MNHSILFISRKWPPAVGGMETYSVELANGLSESSQVRILALEGRQDGGTPSLLAYGFFLLKAVFFCSINARSFNHVVFGDLILFPAAIFHRLFNRKAKRLVIVYGLDLVYQHRKGLLPFLYRIFFSVFRATQSCFSSVVAISRYTASLATAQRIGNVSVVNPCLPSTSFPSHGYEGKLPPAWIQAEGKPRILYFGRLIPRKGALWFASEVMPHLQQEEVEFFVVGDSSDECYKRELKLCSKTHCLGRMDSSALSAMIQAADAVVMPNIPTHENIDVEGFGLVAIETSAQGGRLLASRIDGITDAVIDGVNGILLPPGDVSSWISAIRGLCSTNAEDRIPHRASIASSTRNLFSRQEQAEAFLALLEIPGNARNVQ